MLKTYDMIIDDLSSYANPKMKLQRQVHDGEYIPVKKELYETSAEVPGHLLAACIYGPSYLSFDFALSWYGLIPERVSTFTSATFDKKKKKIYHTAFGVFTFRDVPRKVFPLGIREESEKGFFFQIASPEKALCDKLYSIKRLSNRRELIQVLEADLRIDTESLRELNVSDIDELSRLYRSNNVRLLAAYMRRI